MKTARTFLVLAALAVALSAASATWAGTGDFAAARPDAERTYKIRQIRNIIITEARRMRFPVALALAVAKVESDFDARVESRAGARGVMQIMPATAWDEYAIEADLLWRPRINIRLGIHFLKRLMKRYKGRTDLALSYYNGGSRVGDGPSARVIPVTRKYVKKVRHWQRHYRRLAWSSGETWKSSRQPGVSWKPGRAPN